MRTISSLNEAIVEDAALEWFGELGYAVGHGPHLAPGEPAAERQSCGEVVLVGRLREAIRRLNPAHSRAWKEAKVDKVWWVEEGEANGERWMVDGDEGGAPGGRALSLTAGCSQAR